MLDINLIEDDGFINKDVSELVYEDLYLFHIVHNNRRSEMFYWSKGVVLVMCIKTQEIIKSKDYLTGTLQEYITKFS